jgi:hypothetical protein
MLALEALARGGIGFGLSGALRQQAQGLFGRSGDGFFNMPQILFRMLLDGLQARLEVGAPGLEFGVGELALGESRRRCGRRRPGGAFGHNFLGQAVSGYRLALAGQGAANLACGFLSEGHGGWMGWGWSMGWG